MGGNNFGCPDKWWINYDLHWLSRFLYLLFFLLNSSEWFVVLVQFFLYLDRRFLEPWEQNLGVEPHGGVHRDADSPRGLTIRLAARSKDSSGRRILWTLSNIGFLILLILFLSLFLLLGLFLQLGLFLFLFWFLLLKLKPIFKISNIPWRNNWRTAHRLLHSRWILS